MPTTFADKGAQPGALSNHDVRHLQSFLTREFYSSCDGQYKLAIPWALVLSIALWDAAPRGRILAWFAAVTVSQILSQALCAAFRKASTVTDISVYWKWGLTAAVTVGSLLVGSAGILLFPVGSLPHQFIVALFLCCIGGAAAITYAVHLPGSIISIFLITLPLSGSFFRAGSEFSVTMGAVLLLFAAALVVASAHINKVLHESLRLRFEKDDLIESVLREKEKVEELNGELEAEVLERKLVAASLARSEERYRAFVDSQTELVCRLIPDYGLSFANEAFRRYFNTNSEDLLGRNFFEFVYAGDLETVRDFFQSLDRSVSPAKHQHRVTAAEGEIRWLEWTYQVMRDQLGRVKEYQGVGRDITAQKKAEEALQRSYEELEQRVQERTSELKEANRQLQAEISDRIRAEVSLRESEQRFRTIFEKARDCIFVKDRELKYTHLNPAMQAVFEANESDVTGLTDEDLYGDEQATRLKREDVRVLAGQVIEAEHTLVLRGRELTFNCVKVPMMNSSGEIVGLCGIARDITERLRTQVKPETGELDFTSNAMSRALRQVRLAAKSDSIVLLLGESGSGKDFLAGHIHRLSSRSSGPFFSINCAALARELAESELFGHEAGSFTGARTRKRGMLELAEGGTLLLNEIGELSPTLQSKLLTFLDTRSFTRVGGEANIEVNARLIAATNRDLKSEVEAGRFRHDLYHRLNVFTIEVPPLRERSEDVPLLVDTLLNQLCTNLGCGEIPHMDARCMPKMTQYHWPGNVRELKNVLERALILSEGGKIRPEYIQLWERHEAANDRDRWFCAVSFPDESKNLNEVLKNVKSELMKEALRRTSGVKKDAANLLGISVDSFKYQSKTAGV
ncbi:MAG: sigma 54-interacting transcriptional regulator [Thermodesulfobacteriota bacterium]